MTHDNQSSAEWRAGAVAADYKGQWFTVSTVAYPDEPQATFLYRAEGGTRMARECTPLLPAPEFTSWQEAWDALCKLPQSEVHTNSDGTATNWLTCGDELCIVLELWWDGEITCDARPAENEHHLTIYPAVLLTAANRLTVLQSWLSAAAQSIAQRPGDVAAQVTP